MSSPTVRWLALAALALAVVHCAPSDTATVAAATDGAVVTGDDARDAGGAAEDTAASRPDTLAPGSLGLVPAVPVRRTAPEARPFEVARRTGPQSGVHARQFGSRTLVIALRAAPRDVSRYPCTACHLGRALVASDTVADAHQDITAVHPSDAASRCTTCHAAADVERLVLENGEEVTMDEAYWLCARCHFRQVDDWAAGAHGKRLDGWQGRRVLMSCADCHDPHSPALVSRVPFAAPRLGREGSSQP